MEARGEPIPGSSLYRDFCAICGEPIRVPADKRDLPRNFCLDCMRKAVHKLADALQPRHGHSAPDGSDSEDPCDAGGDGEAE